MAERYKPDSILVRSIIGENLTNQQGVVKPVMETLRSMDRKPLPEFEALLKERRRRTVDDHVVDYYALEGLRSLAATGGIPLKTARLLFTATERISKSPVAHFDEDGSYKNINVLSRSKRTAPAVLEWAEYRLDRMDFPDAGWIAAYAIATVLDKRTGQLTLGLVNKLEVAVDSEERLDRRAQLTAAVQEYRKLLSLNPQG